MPETALLPILCLLVPAAALLRVAWFPIPETALIALPRVPFPALNEDKATRYHRLQRRASLLRTAITMLLLAGVVATGASAALRDVAAAATGGWFIPTAVVYVALLLLLIEALQMPLAVYRGLTLERRFGLSTQTTARWWADQAKGMGIGLVFAAASAALVSGLLRWSSEYWWIAAAAAFSAVTIVLAQLAPVVLLPLFYDFKPLDRPALRDRLVTLAERAGAHVLGVFEWRLGDRTRKANAALAGLGRTRRIILSDTLLAVHSDDEIEVILAHELAHHVHGDIWRGIALETALTALGFLVADRFLEAAAGRFGIAAKWDVAALPLVVLGTRAASMALQPVVNAFSRAHERRADRYALEMTGNVPAFTSAVKRLGAQNLAEERPSRLVEWLFYTHPPVAARVEFARAWSAQQR